MRLLFFLFLFVSCQQFEVENLDSSQASVLHEDGYPLEITMDNYEEFIYAPKSTIERLRTNTSKRGVPSSFVTQSIVDTIGYCYYGNPFAWYVSFETHWYGIFMQLAYNRTTGDYHRVFRGDFTAYYSPSPNAIEDKDTTTWVPYEYVADVFNGPDTFLINATGQIDTVDRCQDEYLLTYGGPHPRECNAEWSTQDYAEAVNVLDVVKILRHWYRTDTLKYVEEFFAADVNMDGLVDTADAYELQALILGTSGWFPQIRSGYNSPWLIVDLWQIECLQYRGQELGYAAMEELYANIASNARMGRRDCITDVGCEARCGQGDCEIQVFDNDGCISVAIKRGDVDFSMLSF